jgi:hypothetical protein
MARGTVVFGCEIFQSIAVSLPSGMNGSTSIGRSGSWSYAPSRCRSLWPASTTRVIYPGLSCVLFRQGATTSKWVALQPSSFHFVNAGIYHKISSTSSLGWNLLQDLVRTLLITVDSVLYDHRGNAFTDDVVGSSPIRLDEYQRNFL